MILRKLFLMRHADALEKYDSITDFERPLSNKGQQQSQMSGTWLAQQNFFFDKIITSSALRTYQTSLIVAKCTHYHLNKIIVYGSLYDSDLMTHINIVEEALSQNDTVLMIGHNPVIGEFASFLTENFRGSFSNGQILGISLPDNVIHVSSGIGLEIIENFIPKFK